MFLVQNDPAAPAPWAHKITEEMEESLFALKLGDHPPLALRTQLPPSLANASAAFSALPVERLTYEGAFPVSRLTAADPRLGAATFFVPFCTKTFAKTGSGQI